VLFVVHDDGRQALAGGALARVLALAGNADVVIGLFERGRAEIGFGTAAREGRGLSWNCSDPANGSGWTGSPAPWPAAFHGAFERRACGLTHALADLGDGQDAVEAHQQFDLGGEIVVAALRNSCWPLGVTA
jgi:hypothetical protein